MPRLSELAAYLATAGWRYGALTQTDGPDGPETVVIARCGDRRVIVRRAGAGPDAVRLALVEVVAGLTAAA